jgi:hypothetical protein
MRRLVQVCSFATATVVAALLFFTNVVDPSFVDVVLGTIGLGLLAGSDVVTDYSKTKGSA